MTVPASVVGFLHPGMPKAASTWLQNEYFAGHPQLAVLGPEDRHADLAARFVTAIGKLVLGGDLQDAAPTLADLAALAGERAARTPGATVVGLSHEALAGAWPTPRNSGFLARTCGAAFPGAKVLLVVREHRAALVSNWREFVRMGGTLSFPRFLFDPALGGDPVVHPLHTAVLDTVLVAPVVRAWREACGAERVLVLPFEQLQRDADGFTAALCAFLGIEPRPAPPVRANVQLSAAALRLLRLANRLFHTRRHPRFGWQPLTSLLVALGWPRGAEFAAARANPWYLRYRIADYAQRWLAKRLLPRLDRLGLAALGRGGDPLARLGAAPRAYLEARFAADTAALRPLVGWAPGAYGYLG